LAAFLASFAIKIFFCLGEIQKTVTAKNAKNFRKVREEVIIKMQEWMPPSGEFETIDVSRKCLIFY